MAMEKVNLARSVETIVSLNGVPLGGQQNAILNRHADIINITNRINGDWGKSIAGKKSWNLNCVGLYIIDDEAFNSMSNAFMNNLPVDVSLTIGTQHLVGKALITDFPLTAIFNKEFKYDIRLLGTGALQEA